jgi:hypothetical protein
MLDVDNSPSRPGHIKDVVRDALEYPYTTN